MPHPWAAEPCLARSSPSSRSISRRDGKGLPYELQQEPQLERMSVDVRMPIGSAPDGRLVGTALPQVQEVQRAVAHLWHHLPRTDEVARASDQCRHGAADVTACTLARWLSAEQEPRVAHWARNKFTARDFDPEICR
jgi:hypothetical protein